MNLKRAGRKTVLAGGLLLLTLTGTVPAAWAAPVSVVVTTTIVGDVVGIVGGGEISLHILVPAGTDPHAFEPTPRDLVSMADADMVFINGVGLEQALIPLLESSGAVIVDLGTRIALRTLMPADEHASEDADEHFEGGIDPHVWFDPTNVMIWTDQIAEALSRADPEHKQLFADRAAGYRGALAELDAWIWEQVSRVPREQRKLVTDHAVLGYFAARYGFTQLGTVLPGFSSLAEASARDVARLQDLIAASGVSAIFVGQTANAALPQQIASDTGVSIVNLYTGALGEEGGPAADYLQMMRVNTTQIVEALQREGGSG